MILKFLEGLIKLAKLIVEKATIKTIANHLIENEETIRQIFFKGRAYEIEGGTFRIKSVAVKTMLPSLYEFETYQEPKYGPMANVLIFVNYQLKRGKRWINKESVISNGILMGFDMPESEHKSFIRDVEEHLLELVNVMCENWRELKPFVRDFLNNRIVGTKIKLYMAEVNKEIKFLWVRSYEELAELIGVTEAVIRPIYVGIQKDMIGEATQDDIKHFHLYGELGVREYLDEQLEYEKSLLERQKQIKKICA